MSAQDENPLDQLVKLRFTDQPITEALSRLEEAGIARFSYNPRILKRLPEVSLTQTQTLKATLDDWLAGTKLRYQVVGQQVVIFRPAAPSSSPSSRNTSKKSGGPSLSGYVVDQRSGERLPYAKVWDLRSGRGTVANAYGFFSLRLPEDSATLMGSFPEYLCHPVSLGVNQNQQVELPLRPYVNLETVAIEADKSSIGPEEVQMSMIVLPVSEVNNMPALLGESDLVRAVQLLPGVQSGAEGTTGLYVRGGSPDQNLILLDGVPLYYVNHWGGFTSVFNSDALSDVRLTKGGFPARFGGRLSSVMEVSMKEGNRKETQFAGSIGLLSVKASVQGPIGPKNEAGEAKTSYILSGRRNYFDLINRGITLATESEPDDGFLGYGFYDFNAKINHIFSAKDRLYISGYMGRDRNQTKQSRTTWTTPEDDVLVQNQAPPSYLSRNQVLQENLNGWGNAFAALRWNHVWNDRAFSNLSVSYSRYDFRTDTRFEQQTEEFGEPVKTTRNTQEFSSEIRDAILRWEMDWYPTHRQQLKWGAQATLHEFEPGIRQTQTILNSETVIDTTLGNKRTRGTEAFFFAEHDWHISNRFRLQTGLHGAGYRFRQRTYFSLQPRIAARAMLGDRLSFKASYAEMQQFVHMLTNQTVGVPVDLWVPATDSVPPQYSRQLAAGLSWESVNGGWEASLEGYYKQMEDLIDYSEGYIDLTQDPTDWENLVEIDGEGLAYGAEFFLQKKRGPLRGWLSYTLSWNWRTFDNINGGKRYPFRYDRRHDFSIVALYTLRPGIELSATWVYGTGQSITLPTGRHESWIQDRNAFPRPGENPRSVEGDIFLFEGGRNNVRMRAFHRLDLGISLTKEKSWGQRIWRLGLYNAYSRRN
ncbi:MAG: TonB-dependent receptor plug domain-containing protein, partial [Bacteroidota bacterium]